MGNSSSGVGGGVIEGVSLEELLSQVHVVFLLEQGRQCVQGSLSSLCGARKIGTSELFQMVFGAVPLAPGPPSSRIHTLRERLLVSAIFSLPSRSHGAIVVSVPHPSFLSLAVMSRASHLLNLLHKHLQQQQQHSCPSPLQCLQSLFPPPFSSSSSLPSILSPLLCLPSSPVFLSPSQLSHCSPLLSSSLSPILRNPSPSSSSLFGLCPPPPQRSPSARLLPSPFPPSSSTKKLSSPSRCSQLLLLCSSLKLSSRTSLLVWRSLLLRAKALMSLAPTCGADAIQWSKEKLKVPSSDMVTVLSISLYHAKDVDVRDALSAALEMIQNL